MNTERCPNMNHSRSNAPVKYCPTCGEVVNKAVPQRGCTEEKHAARRKGQDRYCVDCGKTLR